MVAFIAAIPRPPEWVMWGMLIVGVLVVALGLGGAVARIAGRLLGALVGFFLPGIPLGMLIAHLALRSGSCPDAGWGGPILGALLGAAVGVRIVRRFQKTAQ